MSGTKMGMTIIEFLEQLDKVMEDDFKYYTSIENVHKQHRLLTERNEIGNRVCKELYGISLTDAATLASFLKRYHIEDLKALCGTKVKKKDVKDLFVSSKKLAKQLDNKSQSLDDYYEKHKEELK